MVAIYTTMLLIVFAYLNEYRVFNEGERMLMHKSKHRNYLLTVLKFLYNIIIKICLINNLYFFIIKR